MFSLADDFLKMNLQEVCSFNLFQIFFPDQKRLNVVPDLQVRMELRVTWACLDQKDQLDVKVKRVPQVNIFEQLKIITLKMQLG